VPSASPQKPTGIDGIGAVITSSPSSPTTGLPSGSNAAAATPSEGPAISPSTTGCHGPPWTIPEHTSVPPLPTLSSTPGKRSATQR
jgi:hypothetical protein